MDFATTPADLEKFIFLESDGDIEDRATEEGFRGLVAGCAKHDSHVATVMDSEGQTVCFAPVAIARLIVRLLNDSEEVGDEALHQVCVCGHSRLDHDWWGGGDCTQCKCKQFNLNPFCGDKNKL